MSNLFFGINMKIKSFYSVTILLLAFSFIALFFVSCNEQLNQVCPDNNTGQFGNIEGKVVTTGKNPLSGIEVSSGNIKAYTDSKGIFLLQNVPSGTRVMVNFKSSIYTSTQKIVLVKAGRTSYIDAAVIQLGTNQNLNTSSGGTVLFNGAKVDFPSNGFVDSKGNAFSGTAQVKATWFDPTSNVFCGCFPGEFKGTRTDNSETQIESFGFVNVEILNGSEKLQLASGKQATITFPIPAKLQGKAPQTIPLWYYDEQQGKWLEQGSASKVGTNYVGNVQHFSSWNCDMPTQTSYLQGKVVDSNGDPIVFAAVHSEGVDYTGSSQVFTDDAGAFKLAVKSSSNAKVWANYHIFSSVQQNYATPATGDIQDIGNIIIAVDTSNVCIIVGRLVDNGNIPVSNLYIHLLDSNGKLLEYIYSDQNGKFKFFGELNTKYSIKISAMAGDSSGTDTTITITCPGQAETMDLGDIKLDIGGSTVIGRILNSNNDPLVNVYISSSEFIYIGKQRESQTDSLGKFSLWVRPNKSFKINLYYNQIYKSIDVTSLNLGDTLDLGDIILQ
jgi:hypothetical protein